MRLATCSCGLEFVSGSHREQTDLVVTMVMHWSWGHTLTKANNTALRIVQTIAEGLPALQLTGQPPPIWVGDVTI